MSASVHEATQLDIESSRNETRPQASFDIESYLAEERTKDLLRLSTAGSVDDGKSTLIGRLLYDTQNVYDDQIRSIEGKGSAGEGVLDLALLTDGLRAEREQGITIDVAYRYFSTAKRKFIIADTPGHEQYTRNMATGASTADVAIVLVDARKGVLTQSRRHAYITSLLGVPQIIVAINKMDLADYSQQVFEAICAEFAEFYANIAGAKGLRKPNASGLHFVPVSALVGDNVVRRTDTMPWYRGPSLLDLLESIPTAELVATASFRLPVQRVIRPHQDHRGFAGQIASGTVRQGDAVMVLPSRRMTRVRSIVTFDGDLAEAQAPLSISLTFEDEIDVSRGDLVVSPDAEATVTQRFIASLVWMDERALDLGRRYLLKHASRTVQSQVRSLQHTVDVTTLNVTRAANVPGASLAMNGIAVVEIETSQPLVVDPYSENRITGSFVLIDSQTNATVAAGMIIDAVADIASSPMAEDLDFGGPVTAAERAARWGHIGAHLALIAPSSFADQVERALFLGGAFVVRADSKDAASIAALEQAGTIVITVDSSFEESVVARIGDRQVSISTKEKESPHASIGVVLELLRQTGILQSPRVDRKL